MFKIEKVAIDLSKTFLYKNRCKHCMQPPTIYYRTKGKDNWVSAKDHLDFMMKMISEYDQSKLIRSDWYKAVDPSDMTHNIFIGISYKDHTVRFFKNNRQVFTVRDYLTCECNRTIWSFSDFKNKEKPEYKNRKARVNFHTKFIY